MKLDFDVFFSFVLIGDSRGDSPTQNASFYLLVIRMFFGW